MSCIITLLEKLHRTRKVKNVLCPTHAHKGMDDYFGGFVMIKAKTLTYEAITEALFAGDFYASTGPAFHEIYIEDGKLYIHTSDAVSIGLTTDGRKTKCAYASEGETLNSAVFLLDFEYKYFRITVKDFRGNYAYTNAFFAETI